MQKEITEFTKRRRNLPHWEAPGETYFCSYVLKNRDLCDLSQPNLALIILNAFDYFDGVKYELLDHTVMPDHVHVILQPTVRNGAAVSLSSIWHSLRGYTAKELNRELDRNGVLWLDEPYDRIIRNEREYEEFARYIYENPVVAGLVKSGDEWPWWRRRGSRHRATN